MAEAAIRSRSDSVAVSFPDVVIQDAPKRLAYCVPRQEMPRFRMTPEMLKSLDGGTITFVIPDEHSLMEIDVPAFNAAGTEKPSILIQSSTDDCAFLLSFEALQEFKIEFPVRLDRPYIAFAIPQSLELLEELPLAMSALLQTQEGGCIVIK